MQNNLVFETIGNVELLSQNKVAIFSSKDVSLEITSQATSLIKSISSLSIAIAGGWQAPLEKKVFSFYTKQKSPINLIYYLAKNINLFKASVLQKNLIQRDRLLVIAPQFKEKRPTHKNISMRDELLFSQINKILFLSISPGGRLENYLSKLSSKKYQLYIMEHPENEAYYAEDIVALNQNNMEMLLV